jgi:hypothetical protein
MSCLKMLHVKFYTLFQNVLFVECQFYLHLTGFNEINENSSEFLRVLIQESKLNYLPKIRFVFLILNTKESFRSRD